MQANRASFQLPSSSSTAIMRQPSAPARTPVNLCALGLGFALTSVAFAQERQPIPAPEGAPAPLQDRETVAGGEVRYVPIEVMEDGVPMPGRSTAGILDGEAPAVPADADPYFLGFAERLRKRVDVPLAVTGGFRTAEGMAAAVRSGAVDIVGLARPLALEPDLPKRILAGEDFVSRVRRLTTGSRTVDKLAMLDVTYYETQLARMGAGQAPDPDMHPLKALASNVLALGSAAFKQRRARG